MAKIAAQNDASVFLSGESGTGKELFAQAIHNASSRRRGPFIAVNCGALPKSLIEAELFGYEGGSFTGARRDGCAGKFELANGGTIFLDEIGDMPVDVQITLLRVLQNREVRRIGASKALRIDVRVITATNRDLEQLVDSKVFREDLFYRINVFRINIPSLRERTGDVRQLAGFFLAKYSDIRPGGRVEGFTAEALAMMEAYPGRGTCANWRTAWSGRSTWPRGNWSPPPSSRRRSGPSRDRRPRRLCPRRPSGGEGRTRRRGSRTCSTAPTGTSWRRPACWASAEELYIESSNGITSTTARIGSDIPYDTNETVTQLCAMCGCVTVFVTYVAHSCGALGQRSPGLPWFFKGLRRGRVGMAFACLSKTRPGAVRR